MINVNLADKKIGNFALHHISFSFPMGYILGIIGRNGAGKTSLLNLLLGLYKQDAGDITVFGMTYENAEKEIKNGIGYVLAEELFCNDISLQENGNLFGQFYEEYDAENGLVISGSIFNYYENGNMKSERVTVDEQLVKEVSYYENGIIEEYYEYDPSTGMEISGYGYYENGQMRFQFGFDENGEYYEKEWDHHGTLRYHSGHDEDGYFTKEWDENGNLITEGRGEE